MNKKNIKSLILFSLVSCSILLTVHMWFSEKLWPDGYNFFANWTNFSLSSSFKSSLTKDSISLPENIVITNTETRSIYGSESEEFKEISKTVRDIIELAIESNNYTAVTSEDWNNALKAKSIYAAYPIAYDFKVFSNVMGVSESPLNIKSTKDFVIYAGDDVSDDISVYIKDFSTSEVSMLSVAYDDKKSIRNMITRYAKDSVGNIAYSFELNFDKPLSDGVTQRVTISPDAIIMLGNDSVPAVAENNILFENGEYDYNAINNILRSFGYNTSNPRRYIESDNSIVYVENYDSIRIHQDGLIEYKAVDSNKGITLSSSSSDSIYNVMLSCVDKVNKLWEDSFPDKNLSVNLSSDMVNVTDKSFKLYLDYYVNGTPVNCYLNKTGSHESISHAVEIEVSNYKILSYRQILKYFSATDYVVERASAIEALDKLFAEYDSATGEISEIFLTYTKSGNGLWIPSWAAKTGDDKIEIITN